MSSLQRDGTEVDDADAVKVAAGGITQVVLATKFDQPGQYTMRVGTQHTQPRDYDDSNDSTSFTVQVVAGVQAVRYELAYYDLTGSFSRQWSSSYGTGEVSFTGETQSTWEGLFSSDPAAQLTFPAKGTYRVAVDGGQNPVEKQLNVSGGAQYDSGCYHSSDGFSGLTDGFGLYVQVADACGTPVTFVSAVQMAADYISYSRYHVIYWGDWSYGPATTKFGTFVRPTNSIETRLVATGANGTSIGGNAQAQISHTPVVNSGAYSWFDFFYAWANNFITTYGYSEGMTQP